MENAKYVLTIPIELLNQIRDISLERKKQNLSNKTQKDVFIEMIKIGLMMTEPSTATPHEAHSNSVMNEKELQENPKQIKLV